MRRVTIALAAGLTLMVVAIGLTLLRSPMAVSRKNGTPLREYRIATTATSATYCQADELLPEGTSAIRLALGAYTGPRVAVAISSRGRTLTGGVRGAGWTGRVVTVPLKPLSHAVPATTVCVSFRLRDEQLIAFGEATGQAIAAHDGSQPLDGRMWIEYLRPGKRSWASLVPSIAHRMGLGRAAAGTWIVLVALALLLTIAALASSLVVKELR